MDFSILIHIILTLIGISLGLIGGIFVAFPSKTRATNWGRIFLMPSNTTNQATIAQRAYFFTENASMLSFYAGIIGISLGIFCLVAAVLAQSFGVLLGIPILILFSLYKDSSESDLTSEMPLVAVRQVIRFCAPYDRDQFLDFLATSEVEQLRLTACLGYAMLPTKQALPLLEKMKIDQAHVVCVLAHELISELQSKEAHPVQEDVRLLPSMIEAYDSTYYGFSYLLFNLKGRVHKLEEIEDQFRFHLANNGQFHPNYAQHFCTKCNAYAEKRSYFQWDWVWCRVCHETHHLISGIEAVHGQIGGDEGFAVHNGILTLNLWEADKKLAKVGDIDLLEIIGGKDIATKVFDYDWAVNAVLIEMRNHLPNGQGFELLVTNDPKLEKNSWHLLADFATNVSHKIETSDQKTHVST